jgi:hypothetical protein
MVLVFPRRLNIDVGAALWILIGSMIILPIRRTLLLAPRYMTTICITRGFFFHVSVPILTDLFLFRFGVNTRCTLIRWPPDDNLLAGCRRPDRRSVFDIDLQYVPQKVDELAAAADHPNADLDRISKDAALGNSPLYFGGTSIQHTFI